MGKLSLLAACASHVTVVVEVLTLLCGVSQAEITAHRVQMVNLECWDWDPGFPGVQNDDFLGRYFSSAV